MRLNCLKELAYDIVADPFGMLISYLTYVVGIMCLSFSVSIFVTDRAIDSYYSTSENLVRLQTNFNLPNGDVVRSSMAPFPAYHAIKESSMVEGASFLGNPRVTLKSDITTTTTRDLYTASDNFFSLINPFTTVPPRLKDNEIIITPEFNRDYLGFDEPKGKVIHVESIGLFTIKDVLSIREDTSFRVGAIVNHSALWDNYYHGVSHNWYDVAIYLFAQLSEANTLSSAMLSDFVSQNAPNLPGAPFTAQEFIDLQVNPVSQIHYDLGLPDDIHNTISKATLNIIYMVGFIVACCTVACYFCLSSISLTKKLQSLKVKLSVGCSSSQALFDVLSYQLLFLSFCFISAQILSIVIQQQFDLSPQVQYLIAQNVTTITYVFVGLVTVTLLYESIISYRVIRSVSHNITTTRYEKTAHWSSNHLLLGIQILISGIMVSLGLASYIENERLLKTDYGYQSDRHAVLEIAQSANNTPVTSIPSAIQQDIEFVATSSWRPFDKSRISLGLQHGMQTNEDEFISTNAMYAGPDIHHVLGVETLAGHRSAVQVNPKEFEYNAIVTESFARQFGFNEFEKLINHRFNFTFDSTPYAFTVTKVIQNFELGELSESPLATAILITDQPQRYVIAAFKTEHDLASKLVKFQHSYPGASKGILLEQLQREYFDEQIQIGGVLRGLIAVCIALLVMTSLLVGLSETQKLSRILAIMEAMGAHKTMNVLFLLKRLTLPSLIAAIAALWIGTLASKNVIPLPAYESNIVIFYSGFSITVLALFAAVISVAVYLISHRKLNRAHLE
ncbi:hypothetical protein [Vibrio nomapromontoriensis]|uniref:hypothetical protein n=1 Tax=Vibrio nomapromontoriensis TaxID=2910246 RepID=UPI003D0DECD6